MLNIEQPTIREFHVKIKGEEKKLSLKPTAQFLVNSKVMYKFGGSLRK